MDLAQLLPKQMEAHTMVAVDREDPRHPLQDHLSQSQDQVGQWNTDGAAVRMLELAVVSDVAVANDGTVVAPPGVDVDADAKVNDADGDDDAAMPVVAVATRFAVAAVADREATDWGLADSRQKS